MPGRRFDLTGRQPAWPAGAVAVWRRCQERALAEEGWWRTPEHGGESALVAALSRLAGARPEDLVVTAGVRSSAFALGCRFPEAFHERPGFSGTAAALAAAGARVELQDWETLGVGAGPSALVWLTTPWRNPDGAAATGELRDRLEALSDAGTTVVINESYRAYGGPQLEVRGALRVGSLSKVASGGARLGWIHGPKARDLYLPLHHSLPPALWQRCWAHFLEAGGYHELVAWSVERAVDARERFVAALPPRICSRLSHGGPFVFVEQGAFGGSGLPKRLKGAGLDVGPGGDFLGRPGSARLCFWDVEPGCGEEIAQRFLAAIGREGAP